MGIVGKEVDTGWRSTRRATVVGEQPGPGADAEEVVAAYVSSTTLKCALDSHRACSCLVNLMGLRGWKAAARLSTIRAIAVIAGASRRAFRYDIDPSWHGDISSPMSKQE